jgi:hypothetical protein
MLGADRELSALHRRSSAKSAPAVSSSRNALQNWTVDGSSHPAFDAASGIYISPRDGLYAVCVQVLPCDGTATVARDVSLLVRPRTSVDYVLQVVAPLVGDEDFIAEELFDVGARSYGEVLHLQKGTRLAVLVMPRAGYGDSLRFKVDLVQRKRKRNTEPELSEKEIKKLEKQKKKAERAAAAAASADAYVATDGKAELPVANIPDLTKEASTKNGQAEQSSGSDLVAPKRTRSASGDVEDDDNDDSWSAGFSSDDSGNEDEKVGVGRMAKKLRTAGTGD